tara:strand:+ start:282 stop:1487 length:1206 start_codon:yes stop_codon:yes gene_type:complete
MKNAIRARVELIRSNLKSRISELSLNKLKSVSSRIIDINSFKRYFINKIINVKDNKIKDLFRFKLNLKYFRKIDLESINVKKRLNKRKINLNISNERNYDFIGIHYSEHILTIAHINKYKDSKIIKNQVKINISTDLVGDYKVENIEEIKRVIEDVIEVFGLKDPPIILLLGSSYFTTKTFSDNELIVFSDNDPIIMSKSPYLPINTSIQYQRVSGDKLSSYHIVVYAEKNAIQSWMNVLASLNNPVVALTNGAINLIDQITSKSNDVFSYLCDIEDSSTTIYIKKKNCGLKSIRLPYGTSLYKSTDEKIQNQYFNRLEESINKIIERTDESKSNQNKIYLTGTGLDGLLGNKNRSIYSFDRLSNLKYNEYKIDSQASTKNDYLNKSIFDSFSLLVEEALK